MWQIIIVKKPKRKFVSYIGHRWAIQFLAITYTNGILYFSFHCYLWKMRFSTLFFCFLFLLVLVDHQNFMKRNASCNWMCVTQINKICFVSLVFCWWVFLRFLPFLNESRLKLWIKCYRRCFSHRIDLVWLLRIFVHFCFVCSLVQFSLSTTMFICSVA